MQNQYKKGLILALLLSWPMFALSQEDSMVKINQPRSYSPAVTITHPTNVYFGDTHLHTNLSFDARNFGNKSLTPDDAYRFARGETVVAHNGMEVKLSRPLDFLVVSDHAMNMGLMESLEILEAADWNSEAAKLLYSNFQKLRASKTESSFLKANTVFYSSIWDKEYIPKNRRKNLWHQVSANAENYNEPGKFTAFTGYEWTVSGSRKGYRNLHRVVIFKDESEKTNQVLPFSSFDSDNPEDLWRYLESYETQTGGQVLAIPHNGNLSNGGMFPPIDFEDRPISRDYAVMRSRWEPLVEVTQVKGDGETHPSISPDDDFADYETWDSWQVRRYKGLKTEAWQRRKASEYARSALKLGLNHQVELGVNPFKFGMIGSTDAHTSLATADENNFWGKFSEKEPHTTRSLDPLVKLESYKETFNWQTAASGYAAVWAQENTRESLFAAMKRKEVYATTGPRMKVRFFGGWNYDAADAFRADLATIGYNKGVPMGGDLTNAPIGMSPNFLIRAVRDPNGANLDRVQIIKGWRTASGELEEKVYDVALSDGRKVRWNGKVKPVGSTVDIKDASYSNSIGDPELAVVWTDPEFNPDELAFYYVRVLEIPTPRWTAYDAKFFGLKDLPKEIPMVTQERAYTSPIWYTPAD